MRTTSTATKNVWASGDYVGVNRPIVRATIQRLKVMCLSYRKAGYGRQTYSSVPFGQSRPVELPNLKDVQWQRTVDSGVATMTMTLYNTHPLPVGQPPQNGDLDQPGYFSPLRGKTSYSSRWDRSTNGWQDWIVPDRIIRTYEGYGINTGVAPELDEHLYPSGTWRIDDVDFTNDGSQALIKITCRDIGSILLDQIAFPPVVPFDIYPAWFQTSHNVRNPNVVTTTGSWFKPTYETSSNKPYVGNGGAIHGHLGTHAFDSSTTSYWLSVGNSRPNADYSFEFIQGKFSSRTVAGGQVRVWGGPYTCYVSVYAGGKWQGDQTVPYDPTDPISAPNGANIRFVKSFRIGSEDTHGFKLPKVLSGATKMRLTFTSLCNSGIGPWIYRAGVRNFQVSSTVTTSASAGTHVEPKISPPRITDYTDIVKIFLAWAGFYWPKEASHAFVTNTSGTKTTMTPTVNDPVLIQGRVWGDFERAGTSPLAAIPVNNWDKKPIMDCINYVKDIVGYIFFIDEEGGAVFRSPNIWKTGNWIGNGGPNAGRTSTTVVIDETTTLMSLSATMSGRSIREKIFVGNISGHKAAMSAGHNPYPSGLRRVGGYTDQHFLTNKECQIMADLITLRQLFTYRTDKVEIPGNPAIQIDDQVRIYERTSEEGYRHYVTGISMNWSLETGRYTYGLDVHWLGDVTFSNWTFNPAKMSKETQAYLRAMGRF